MPAGGFPDVAGKLEEEDASAVFYHPEADFLSLGYLFFFWAEG